MISVLMKKAMLSDSWECLLEVLEDKSIELTQTGLIVQIIAAMGLEEDVNIVMTPAEYGGLPKR